MKIKRFSRFDMLVALVSLALIVTVALTAVLANPARRGPRIAFLAPAYGSVPDIWMAEVNNPQGAEQLTFSQRGIYDFDVSPDGRFIAYSERDALSPYTEIRLLDLTTRQARPLTNCIAEAADCKSPLFRPDGKVIAYTRAESSIDPGGGLGSSRIWLADLTTNPVTTRPMFEDSQIVGHSPQWSADGRTLAFMNSNIANQAMLIYDFDALDPEAALTTVPSPYGAMGALSPNGQQLVYSELVRKEEGMLAYLRMADLGTQNVTILTPPEEPIDDVASAWNPDGKRLAIARKYWDERGTRGHQIYLLDTTDQSITPLIVDSRYSSVFFSWNRAGSMLLAQRFPELTEDGRINDTGRPEVWVYELESAALTLVAVNAFLPRWVN